MNIIGLYGAFDWNGNLSFNENGEPTWVHDSGATLVINGKHVSSISEERLTKTKYEGNFPKNSILYVLKEGNLQPSDIDLVCVPRNLSMNAGSSFFNEDACEKIIKDLFPNAKVKFLHHHLCHAASSIFSSDISSGSFIVFDGAGSWVEEHGRPFCIETSSIGEFDKQSGTFKFYNILSGFSLGDYYNARAVPIYVEKTGKKDIPFELLRESCAGKIMGLSAYGDHSKINGWKDCEIKEGYGGIPTLDYINQTQNNLFSIDKYELLNPEDQSALLQKNFEHILIDYLGTLKQKGYLSNNICLSGGSFLNVLGNSEILKSNIFEQIHVPPFTSDVGLHLGAALYGAFLEKQEVSFPNNISLLGKEYTNDDIEKEILNKSLNSEFVSDDELYSKTAQLLSENKIIGWFQGRSEFGPRALGSRSILMNPKLAENKDILNSRVKHREYWRPFAGIILEEYLNEYFVEDIKSPYMLYSLTVRDEKVEEIAAITHVDNSCRIQTVNEDYNSRVTNLLIKYKEITGTPVILNTSFNDNGKPIVETPADAIEAFLNMDIDYLVIGNYIIAK